MRIYHVVVETIVLLAYRLNPVEIVIGKRRIVEDGKSHAVSSLDYPRGIKITQPRWKGCLSKEDRRLMTLGLSIRSASAVVEGYAHFL